MPRTREWRKDRHTTHTESWPSDSLREATPAAWRLGAFLIYLLVERGWPQGEVPVGCSLRLHPSWRRKLCLIAPYTNWFSYRSSLPSQYLYLDQQKALQFPGIWGSEFLGVVVSHSLRASSAPHTSLFSCFGTHTRTQLPRPPRIPAFCWTFSWLLKL